MTVDTELKMKKGSKVLTSDGPGTIVKFRNGVYVVWAFVKLDAPEWKGTISKYPKHTLRHFKS